MGNSLGHPVIQQPERIRIYKLIPFPTFEELRVAAARWEEIAGHRTRYAFGGTFVALLRNGLVEARNIEIIVQRDGLKEATKIKNDNPQYLGITEHNDHVIVVREDEIYSFGVSVHCFETGTNGYPYELVPPYESRLRTSEHGNLEPTYYQKSLELPENDRSVPIIRSKFLLYQRLFRFQRDQSATVGELEQKRLILDILDIRVFLHCAAHDQNEPFSKEVLPVLTHVVRNWKLFAEINFVDTTQDDVRAWIQLGLPLSLYYDVSAPCRGI